MNTLYKLYSPQNKASVYPVHSQFLLFSLTSSKYNFEVESVYLCRDKTLKILNWKNQCNSGDGNSSILLCQGNINVQNKMSCLREWNQSILGMQNIIFFGEFS